VPNHSSWQVNVCEEMKEVEHLDFHDIDDRSKLSQLVEKIDKDVSHIIFNIVKSGKLR
jgi:formiminoglutamase